MVLEGLPLYEKERELESLVTAFGGLPERGATDEGSVAERVRGAAVHKKRLAKLFKESPDLVRAVEEGVRRLNGRSEEHTSELQSRQYLVCRLLLEKKKNTTSITPR